MRRLIELSSPVYMLLWNYREPPYAVVKYKTEKNPEVKLGWPNGKKIKKNLLID